MSESKLKVAPAEDPRPAKSKSVTLFDLFKDYRDYEIEWNGHAVPIRFMALDYGQQMLLNKVLDKAREDARREIDRPEIREEFEAAARQQPLEKLIDQILVFEEPTADALADLAPSIEDDDDDEVRAKKLAEAKEKWKDHRRQELMTGAQEDVYTVLVQRQISLAIQGQAVSAFVDRSIIEQVVDPATGERILSADPKASNSIERLAGVTRRKLAELRQEFMMKDLDIRRIAEDTAFLQSGASPSAPTDSPGATTETPSGSPPASSPSTPSGAGSTT